MISVIIPTLDEEAALRRLLPLLAATAQAGSVASGAGVSGPGVEIIVVDGSSGDRTVAVVSAAAGARVLQSRPPRSLQLNAAAKLAAGDVLFFLHADARPPVGWASEIDRALADARTVGGAFALQIDAAGAAPWLVAWGANLRTRLTRSPYGDQGIFVRRDVFRAIGGFAQFPFMEDLEFTHRLKRCGRLHLSRHRMTVSARRWRRDGYLRTTLRNVVIAGAFYLGLDWRRFASWTQPVRLEGEDAAGSPPVAEPVPESNQRR